MSEAKVEIRVGATKGLPNYSSVRLDVGLVITVDLEGDSLPDWLNELTVVEDQVRNNLTYGVADALSLDVSVDERGNAQLVMPEPPPPPAAAQPAAQQQSAGAQQGSGQAPPKVSREEYAALPRVHLDMGDGLKVYVDQRPLKIKGTYANNAPDFKVDEPKGKGYWIKDQNQNVVFAVAQAMSNAGIS